MSDQRLAVKHSDDPRVRTYFVTSIVSNARIDNVSRDVYRTSTPKSTRGIEADDKTVELIHDLFKIRAIDTISLNETSVCVTLRELFFWHDAQDDIILAILARLGWRTMDTDILSYENIPNCSCHVKTSATSADSTGDQPTPPITLEGLFGNVIGFVSDLVAATRVEIALFMDSATAAPNDNTTSPKPATDPTKSQPPS